MYVFIASYSKYVQISTNKYVQIIATLSLLRISSNAALIPRQNNSIRLKVVHLFPMVSGRMPVAASICPRVPRPGVSRGQIHSLSLLLLGF